MSSMCGQRGEGSPPEKGLGGARPEARVGLVLSPLLGRRAGWWGVGAAARRLPGVPMAPGQGGRQRPPHRRPQRVLGGASVRVPASPSSGLERHVLLSNSAPVAGQPHAQHAGGRVFWARPPRREHGRWPRPGAALTTCCQRGRGLQGGRVPSPSERGDPRSQSGTCPGQSRGELGGAAGRTGQAPPLRARPAHQLPGPAPHL